ncbi:MAG TPA: hypothetical protein VIM71_06935 [Lacunisphaera sp.]
MPLAPIPRTRLQASLACVITLALWYWRRGQLPAAVAGLAAALALLAWVSPARYAPIQRALDRGVHLILAAITWLLLGIVWLLVFTPLRAFRTLTGRDALARSFDPKAASYLQTPPVAGRFDRQF